VQAIADISEKRNAAVKAAAFAEILQTRAAGMAQGNYDDESSIHRFL